MSSCYISGCNSHGTVLGQGRWSSQGSRPVATTIICYAKVASAIVPKLPCATICYAKGYPGSMSKLHQRLQRKRLAGACRPMFLIAPRAHASCSMVGTAIVSFMSSTPTAPQHVAS